jgi:hypothetical protein
MVGIISSPSSASLSFLQAATITAAAIVGIQQKRHITSHQVTQLIGQHIKENEEDDEANAGQHIAIEL